MKTPRTDFFNQVAMTEDTSHSGEVNLKKNPDALRTAEEYANIVAATLYALPMEELSFSSGEGTWAQKVFSNGCIRKNVANRAYVDGSIIDVVDLAPGSRPSYGIVADGTIVMDRFVVVQNAEKKEGAENTVILHLSPTHAPVVSLITDSMREDGTFTMTRLVTNQQYEGLEHMIAAVHYFVGNLAPHIEDPAWVRDFDKNFKITDSPEGYPNDKPGINNRRLAPR